MVRIEPRFSQIYEFDAMDHGNREREGEGESYCHSLSPASMNMKLYNCTLEVPKNLESFFICH